MAQLIPNPHPFDTPKVVEDKTRDMPANQGLNESAMWAKIDTEVASARSAGKLVENEKYVSSNKHGK